LLIGERKSLRYIHGCDIHDKVKKKPQPLFHFPHVLEDKKLADIIPQFCFPEDKISIEGYDKNKETVEEEFSFVLTVSDGSKRFGFCRRFLKKPEPGFQPVCFCLVSAWSSFSLFQQVMDHVELLLPGGKEAVQGYMTAVLSKPFPSKGGTLVLDGNPATFRLTRSSNDYEYLDYVSFEPIFNSLSVKTILTIFMALVEERRIIGLGLTLPQISACMNAITALVYPFSCQHVFIPILPRSLINMVEAPVPFIIGLQKDPEVDLLSKYAIEEGTIIIDLETGEFVDQVPYQSDVSLPSRLSATLSKNLERLKSATETRGNAFNQMVAHIFLKFWLELFNGYTRFFLDHKFSTAKFLKSRPQATKPFLQTFTASQMYEMFIQEREEMSTKDKLNQCVLCQYNSDPRKKVETSTKGSKSRLKSEYKKERTLQRSELDLGLSPPQTPPVKRKDKDSQPNIHHKKMASLDEGTGGKSSTEDVPVSEDLKNSSENDSTESYKDGEIPRGLGLDNVISPREKEKIGILAIKKAYNSNKIKGKGFLVNKPRSVSNAYESKSRHDDEKDDITSLAKAKQLLGPDFRLERIFWKIKN